MSADEPTTDDAAESLWTTTRVPPDAPPEPDDEGSEAAPLWTSTRVPPDDPDD